MTHNFKLEREEAVQEVNGKAALYRHTESGAQLFFVHNDDNNRVFGVAFRTPPSDSTGVPHILEHTVLCGSKRYPLKDPFLQLLKGSMNTFLNAFTAPDRTVYPLASINEQDFRNQVGVYLDAVFQPLLREEAFLQEGWRFETSPGTPLTLNGIVFNEMKGAYSDAGRIFAVRTQQSLFPDNPYVHDSGGDPREILALTYEQFLEFHRTHYHPSRAFLYLYGNVDLEPFLELFEQYVGGISQPAAPIPVPALQPRFDTPRKAQFFYMPGDQENKTYIAVNWLLGEVRDSVESLGLTLLDHVLLMAPFSPLRNALLESGLGEGLSAHGLSTYLREYTFSAGLKGVREEDCDKVEELVLDTLSALHRDGISKESWQASLHQLEFSVRENNTGSHPQGLALMSGIVRDWIYDLDPFDGVKFEKDFAAVKKLLADDPRYLEGLLEKHLLKNRHRTTVRLSPDKEKALEERSKEEAFVKAAEQALTPEERAKLEAQTARVRAYQEESDTPQALQKLPRLALTDVSRTIERIPSEIRELGRTKILLHDLPTRGLAYLQYGFPLDRVPEALLPMAPMYSRFLTELGTEREDYAAFTQRMYATLGSFWGAPYIETHYVSHDLIPYFFVGGKVTYAHVPDLVDISCEALRDVNLGLQDRMVQIVRESRTYKEQSLLHAGNSYARRRLAAPFSAEQSIEELLSGITALEFLRGFEKDLGQNWRATQTNIVAFREALFRGRPTVVDVVAEAAHWPEIVQQIERLLASFDDTEPASAAWDFSRTGRHEYFTIPAEVQFVGKGCRLFDPGSPPGGGILVALKYLNRTYLWEQVRVQGGAYGAGASLDRTNGTLIFTSYRDKHLDRTLGVYDSAAEHLLTVDLSEEEIERLKIGTLSDIDQHLLPDAKGQRALSHFLRGVTEEERQRIRDEIFAASITDIRELGRLLRDALPGGSVCVLGPEGPGKSLQGALAGLSVETLL